MSHAGLATLSDNLLIVAVLGYALAMLGYAAEYAFGRSGRVAVRTRAAAPRAAAPPRVAETALVGASAVGPGAGSAGRLPAPPGALPAPTGGAAPAAAVPAAAGGPPSRPALAHAGGGPAATLGRAAVALTVLGWVAHLGSVTARGLAAGRVPWGNMYEFSSAVALAAVTAYLVLLTRQRVRYLGAFVMLPVVLYLGLAGTVLYSRAAPLVPALNSYWIKIHVVAAVIASGLFMVGAVATGLYLLQSRHERLVAAGRPVRLAGVGRLLPPADTLDRTTYRIIAFAFPIWTFAIIAGAIWAEAAWGRYWGWDPKETWSFIAWVVYAGYLHARSTVGWRGRRAAMIALVGFAALVADYYGVNIWITGLHSYAGI